MTDVDDAIRKAIGGDEGARRWLTARADADGEPLVQVMVGILDRDGGRIVEGGRRAVTRHDRQVVEIARAHLAGEHERVDALARDHLVDHPDSLLVAWIAGASRPAPRSERC